MSAIAPADHAITGRSPTAASTSNSTSRLSSTATWPPAITIASVVAIAARSSARWRDSANRSRGLSVASNSAWTAAQRATWIAVDEPHELERRRELLGEQLGARVADLDRAQRRLGVVEPDAIEVLHQLEPDLARLVRDRQLLVAGEDLRRR